MKLDFKYPKILNLNDPFTGKAFERIKRTLTSIMQKQKDRVFKNQSDPDGRAWKPLSQLAIANRPVGPKKKNPMILQDTGALKNSLTDANAPYSIRTSSGNEIVLGTNIVYAKIHQFGGVIRPKKAKALAIPTANGVLFAKKVTIPARPFLGFGESDEAQVSEYLSSATHDEMKP